MAAVGEDELSAAGRDDWDRWRYSESVPNHEYLDPTSPQDPRWMTNFDLNLPPLRSMRHGVSIHNRSITGEYDGTAVEAVTQNDARRGLQDGLQDRQNEPFTFDLPLRGVGPSGPPTAPRTMPVETQQSTDQLQSETGRFPGHVNNLPSHDGEGRLEATVVSDARQIQPRIEHMIPAAHPPIAQARRYRRRSATLERPRTTPSLPPAEGIAAESNARATTPRRLPVYNDGSLATEQPQTPRHLPEARHQSIFDGSYTAPAGELRVRPGMETTGAYTRGVQARRGGSPSGSRRPGFQGLYGGRENAEEE